MTGESSQSVGAEDVDTRADGGTAEETRSTRETVLSRIWLDVAGRYEHFQALEHDDMEWIRRHGIGSRLSHWGMVAFMTTCILTGLGFWQGWYGPLSLGVWDGYYVAWILHIWAGIFLAVVAFVLYPYYHAVADGHHLLVSIDQIKEEIVIALSFVGLTSYIPGYKNARKTYDETEGEWQAAHPMQTVFWYITWFFVGVLTLTGFALWDNMASDPAWWISGLGFLSGWFGHTLLLRAHLLSTFFVVAAVGVHAYFPLMPSNLKYLKSMFTGQIKGWRIDEDSQPDTDRAYRTTDTLADGLNGVAERLGTGRSIQARLGGAQRADDPNEPIDDATANELNDHAVDDDP